VKLLHLNSKHRKHIEILRSGLQERSSLSIAGKGGEQRYTVPRLDSKIASNRILTHRLAVIGSVQPEVNFWELGQAFFGHRKEEIEVLPFYKKGETNNLSIFWKGGKLRRGKVHSDIDPKKGTN